MEEPNKNKITDINPLQPELNLLKIAEQSGKKDRMKEVGYCQEKSLSKLLSPRTM